jgi:hypothetical protein
MPMIARFRSPLVFAGCLCFGAFAALTMAQQQSTPPNSAPQAQKPSDMPGMDMSGAPNPSHPSPAAAQADSAMSDMHMEMNGHMFMTTLRPPNPADQKRADEILAALRPAIEKYKDYHVALADGFRIFLPNVPQEHYHFTSYTYAFEAAFKFNPEHPTSLLYKKTPQGYQLEGAMYTAPRRFSEAQLDERVPLSVTEWHQHVNLCLPPKDQGWQADMTKFGLRGSITTEDACKQADGRWHAVVFGWMVHVYPYETDPAKIWAH